MPRKLAQDHEAFRNVISGAAQKWLRDAIKAGTISRKFRQPGMSTVTINSPRIKEITEEEFQQMLARAGRPGKVGKYRRIDEPWEISCENL